ncbi:hypothetical protein [Olivibacter sitiensis]|uniref:hypothetical protein n=1 Tax=Olivibacter sitiensis TaxID=376470 RepID=UPI000429B97E|nr:hypothetical protein [Olivibacter sitiensis]
MNTTYINSKYILARHFTKLGQVALLLYVLLSSNVLFAQESSVDVKGSIKDEKHSPIDFATLSLLHAADSSHIRSSYADEQGNFVIRQ